MNTTKTIGLFLALALAGACSGSAAPVLSHEQAVTTVDSWQLRGDMAGGGLWSENWEDPSCWQSRSVSVWASAQTSHNDGGPPSFGEGGYADYYESSFCDGTYQYRYASVALEGAGINLDRLNGASITFSATGVSGSWTCDEFTCEWVDGDAIQIEGDIDLTGVGDTFRGNSQYWNGYSAGPYRTNYRTRYNGSSREATLSGSFTVDGVPVAFDGGSWGYLASANSGGISQYKY